MKRCSAFVAAAVLLAATGPSAADTMIQSKKHQDAFEMAGQPAKDSTQTTWFTKDRMAVSSDGTTMLVRADQKKLYLLDASDKTGMVVDLPVDTAKLLPEEMRGMLEMMKMAVKVTPGEEKQKIGAWNTQKLVFEITNPQMKITQVMWVTKDIKFDVPGYRDLVGAMQSLQPGTADLIAETKKIDGVPVLVEATIDFGGASLKMKEEIVSVEEKAAPAGTYDVPADYKVEAFDYVKQQMKAQMKAAGGGK